MKAVLEIVKRYLFEIVCGAVAAVAIVLAFIGLGSMKSITESMTQAQQVQSQIATMARSKEVMNAAWVTKAQERIDHIKSSFSTVMAYVKGINERKELLPDTPLDKTDLKKEADFKKAYIAEVDKWLPMLAAGDAPTEQDVIREIDLMAAEEPKDTFADAKKDEDKGDKTGKAPPAKDEGKKAEAMVRAAVRKARSIRLYATKASFQSSDISRPDGPMYREMRPSPDEMWYAQIELWVQRDIVDAIAAINEAKAKQLAAAGDKNPPWVGELPIKEIISVQMTQYYLRDPATAGATTPPPPGRSAPPPPPPGGRRPPPGGAPGGPGGSAPPPSAPRATGPLRDRAAPIEAGEPVFTGRFSNDLHEVVRFTVKLVVDEREIPSVIGGLCEKRFTVPLRVAYEEMPPDISMTGKIYGEGPVAVLTVDFETMLFSEFYIPIMPDSVLTALGKVRPSPPPGSQG